MKKKLMIISLLINSLIAKAIDFKGEFHVKDAPVIAPNKIVVYKEGSEADGRNGLVFNYKIQKNKTIDIKQKIGEQIYWIKEVPQGPGLTEKEIRSGNYIVPEEKIQVGMSGTSSIIYYAVRIDPDISFSSVRIGNYNQLGTLGIKATYDNNLKIFLKGTAGSSPGEVKLNGKFGIKVTS